MKHTKTLAALVFATSALSLHAHAGNVDPSTYGMSAPESTAARVVDITATTRHVAVTDGETITFKVDGQRFTWTFRMYHNEGVVALAAILPQALDARGVMVYVSPDPSYR